MVPAVVCPLLLMPLLLQGDFCTSCGAPFQRSFVTFEVLPLVEFQLEAGISDAEALALLGEDVLATTAADAGGGWGKVLGPGQGGVCAGANVLQLDDDGSAGLQDAAAGYSGALEDAFSAQVRCIVSKVATFALHSLLHVVGPFLGRAPVRASAPLWSLFPACRLPCRTCRLCWDVLRCGGCGPARCACDAGPTPACQRSGSGCWTRTSL